MIKLLVLQGDSVDDQVAGMRALSIKDVQGDSVDDQVPGMRALSIKDEIQGDSVELVRVVVSGIQGDQDDSVETQGGDFDEVQGDLVRMHELSECGIQGDSETFRERVQGDQVGMHELPGCERGDIEIQGGPVRMHELPVSGVQGDSETFRVGVQGDQVGMHELPGGERGNMELQGDPVRMHELPECGIQGVQGDQVGMHELPGGERGDMELQGDPVRMKMEDRCRCYGQNWNGENWENFWETEEGQDSSFWTRPERIRVKASKVKEYRRKEWEERMRDELEDGDRLWQSSEVLSEDLQDFEVPQVIIGCDVDAMYPSLDMEECCKIVREEVLRSSRTWQDLDYQEGARMIALNKSADWCRRSSLRRVLPVRRKRKGSRPGVKGKGPMGMGRGDTEQWIFPEITLTEEEKKLIIAEVWAITTEKMFHHHLYTFGGRTYRQRKGGPIGLRGTCAIARLVMCSWDRKWMEMMSNQGVEILKYMRYKNNGRACLPPIKAGWRWIDGGVKYKEEWRRCDEGLSGQEITRRVLEGSMQEVYGFLKFTTEVGEGEENWLPTLDIKIRVEENNIISFSYYQKPSVTNVTVQKRSAMGENNKIQILSNDMIRRLSNMDPRQKKEEIAKVVDSYAVKLLTSGWDEEQVRRIVLGGIRGWERKKMRAIEEGRNLYRTAGQSAEGRGKRKLLGKCTWYRKRRNASRGGGVKWTGEEERRKPGRRQNQRGKEDDGLKTRAVLFVENTKNGELARNLREVMERLKNVLQYKVKVVEKAGTPLKLLFPLSQVGRAEVCGRERCITCNQEGEKKPQCMKRSTLYENICKLCNPGVTNKNPELNPPKNQPSIYVGESAKSVQERGMEHWRGFKERREDSHILKHHLLHHGGEGDPQFHLRVVGHFRSALTRQVAEAVRIARWGEEVVLNSKSEFNRCQLGRLTLGEEHLKPSKIPPQPETLPTTTTSTTPNTSSTIDTPNNTNPEAPETYQPEEDGMEPGDDKVIDWERMKVEQRRVEEIKGMVDLERGIAMTSSKKRSEDEEGEEPSSGGIGRRKQRKLLHPVLEDNWGESKDDLGGAQEQRHSDRRKGRRSKNAESPGSSAQPVDDKGNSTNNTVEASGTTAPEKGVIKTLPASQDTPVVVERSGEALRTGRTSRDNLNSSNISYNAHRQTSIAKYFASERKAPLSVPQLSQVLREEGEGASTEKELMLTINERKDDDTADPSSGSPSSEVGNIGKKMTFDTGCGSVNNRVRLLQEINKKICVMGNGMCKTHNLKLKKTVKSKKMSCVNAGGGIGWKYVDVTCLMCPGKNSSISGNDVAMDQTGGGANRKKRKVLVDSQNSDNQSENKIKSLECTPGS